MTTVDWDALEAAMQAAVECVEDEPHSRADVTLLATIRVMAVALDCVEDAERVIGIWEKNSGKWYWA